MIPYSVLISVYHREQSQYLDLALSSVFNQTASPAEVILVKDGPLTSDLDAVVDKYCNLYPQLRVIPLTRNVGLGAALQEGLKLCSHELVARMDSDDVCVKDRFERQLAVFAQHPEYDIVGGWIDEFTITPDQPESLRKLPETPESIQKFFLTRSPLNHVTVMFRRSSVLDAGSYQPFYLLEDYWLWGRMLHNGAKFYNIPAVLVHVRGGQAMAARRGGWKYARSEVRLQYEFLRLGLIGYGIFCRNVIIRFTVRIMPNRLRTFVYQKLLRK